jgi:ribosomal protein S18 acetylase RimI-like enzyme
MLFFVTIIPALTYRRIDPHADADLAFANYRDAAIASFGPGTRSAERKRYLPWLRSRVEEFPDGHVLAFAGDQCVGQLELQVPYGLAIGYVNLFYVSREYRHQGFGRVLHDYAERYFRSWDATRIELDVSLGNTQAVGFYQRLGYEFAPGKALGPAYQRMFKVLPPT